MNLVLPRSDTGDCPDQSIMASAMLLIAHSVEYNEAGDLSVSRWVLSSETNRGKDSRQMRK